MPHPCQSCGACCAAYRVSSHWLGLASAGGAIPDALAEPVDRFQRMAGVTT